MRVSPRWLFATPTNLGTGKGLKPAPMALLPPIPLYRRVLRSHRRLPNEMRVLGDEYVKSEFRAHRTVENPMHIVSSTLRPCMMVLQTNRLQIGFLTEWQMYAQQIEGESWKGAKLDKAKIDKMSGMWDISMGYEYQR